MKKVGPELEELLHWLADCPAEFYQHPIQATQPPKGKSNVSTPGLAPIHVAAIVSDHLRDYQLPQTVIRQTGQRIAKLKVNEQQLVAITTWLLRAPWFLERPEFAEPVGKLLSQGFPELAKSIKPASAVLDADRREELVRLSLRALGYRPAGETERQARDRLNTLDSAERVRVVAKTRAAEARARKIREAMAKKRAEEAAARYAPE